MEASREAELAWERRWSVPAAAAAFGSIAVFIASVVVVSSVGGTGEAGGLRSVHDHGSTITASSVLQAIALLLLVVPLVYLFHAALARAPSMRRQFLPLVVIAPVALCVASVLNGVAANNAASTFVEGGGKSTLSQSDATTECRSERSEDATSFGEEFGKGNGAVSACATEKRENDRAENAISETSPRSIAALLQLIGTLSFAIGLGYASFHAMRAGLLTRFWGSLGIALGIAAVLGLFLFAVLWFAYLGLLILGWLPRGRPPAWAAGEAVPWPSPGEKAAESLEPREAESDGSEPEPPALPPGPRRKRKQRD